MKTYTASELKQNIGDVLSDVQTRGSVKIKSRSRPDMVLITQDKLDRMLVAAAERANKYDLEA
jgi:prevent-host-death family protein